MTPSRGAGVVLLAAALVGGLAYLRDPPWLAETTSGMQPWTTDEDGTRVRWIGGRSSFFVPADARVIVLPVRTTFHDPADWPINVRVTIDDRPVEELALRDARWRRIELRLPRPGSRRHRRIDIHLDRTRLELRGALLGEVQVRH